MEMQSIWVPSIVPRVNLDTGLEEIGPSDIDYLNLAIMNAHITHEDLRKEMDSHYIP